MGALIHLKSDDASARYINPIISVLKNDTAHVDNIYVGQWSSASVPTARFRNANTSGKSLVAYAQNASTEILACDNTGVTMAGTLSVSSNVHVGGNLDVTGTTDLTGTLTATGNVVLGNNAASDTLTVNAIETHNGASTFNNSLVSESAFLSNGATTLGNAAADALTVNATSSFLSPVTVSGTFATESTTTLGNAAGDVITVNGTSTFAAGATFSSTLDVDGAATFDSGVTLGNAAGDAITVTGTATFAQTPLFQANIDVQGGTAGQIRAGAVIVGASSLSGTEELRVVGQSLFGGDVTGTGWVRLADGSAATPAYSFTSDTNSGMYSSSGDQVAFSTGGTARVIVTSGVLYGPDGSAGSPGLSFLADGTVGMRRQGTGDGVLDSGGTNRVRWNGTGVAVNGATPAARPDYTITNPTTDRALNVTGDTLAQGLAVLGTVIQDLIDIGWFQ